MIPYELSLDIYYSRSNKLREKAKVPYLYVLFNIYLFYLYVPYIYIYLFYFFSFSFHTRKGYKYLGLKTILWAQLCEAENKGLQCYYVLSSTSLCRNSPPFAVHFFFFFFHNVCLKQTTASLNESNLSIFFLS